MKRNQIFAMAAVMALLLASGCGSTDLGGILGGGSNQSGEIRGTVDSIDLSSRSIYLSRVNSGSMLSSGGGSGSTRVFFDNSTSVSYQGRSYRPEDLERGDEVVVQVEETNNGLYARAMNVTYNAGGAVGTSTHGSTLRGTVRYVDSSRRTIEIQDYSSGRSSIVEYDSGFSIYYNGRNYRPEDLERGDEIEVRLRTMSGGRMMAESATVLRSVSTGSGTLGSSSATNVIRGTVRYVDTSRRTIELENTSVVNTYKSKVPSTVIIQYDSNVGVYVRGQFNEVENLERGDVIEVQAQSMGGSTYRAQRIDLVRDVRQ